MSQKLRAARHLFVALSLCIPVGILPLTAPAGANPTSGVGSVDVRVHQGHTYKFRARVTDNGGVTPFKIGTLLRGGFTYDPRGKGQRPGAPQYGRYFSSQNALSFWLGDQRFRGAGDILATVGI